MPTKQEEAVEKLQAAWNTRYEAVMQLLNQIPQPKPKKSKQNG